MASLYPATARFSKLGIHVNETSISLGARLFLLFIGMSLPLKVHFIGELFIGELLLLLFVAAQLVCSPRRIGRWPDYLKWLIVSLLVSTLGYVLSDAIAGTEMTNLLRGWSKLFFTAVDVIAVYMLVRSSSIRLIWLVIGVSCSGVALGLMQLRHEALLNVWKIDLGFPFALLAVAAALVAPHARRYVAPLCLVCIGALSISLDCRSMGAAFIACGCLQLAKSTEMKRWKLVSYIVTAAVLATGIGLVGYMYYTGVKEFGRRRSESNSGRLAGLTVAAKAIVASPFVGHGSWSGFTDDALAAYRGSIRRAGMDPAQGESNFVGAHSAILQFWFEGGLLGAAFPFYVGMLLVRGALAFRKPGVANISAALLARLFVFDGLWSLLFSPYGGIMRMHMALTIAALSVLFSASNAFKTTAVGAERMYRWQPRRHPLLGIDRKPRPVQG
jgi:hypothetical protein